jgi:hypothetical protein
MSPAAPALIQAARAHQQAGHLDRAATLALRLTLEHQDDANAVQFGEGMLAQLAPKFVRVDVGCEGCKLDVDGTLQESQSFFVEPDVNHVVTANFETGEQRGEVSGHAGETKSIEFVAPPPPPTPAADEGGHLGVSGTSDEKARPLQPIFTYIGAGVTIALLAGSIVSTVDTTSGVNAYEDDAKKWRDCAAKPNNAPNACAELQANAKDELKTGQGKEKRTTALWIATGAVAAGTAVIALFLTDWSGGEKKDGMALKRELRFAAAPTPEGAALWMTGRF